MVVRRPDLPDGFDFVKFPFAKKRDWASSGHHLNRFGPPALQLYKHLSNGEGGSVPAGGAALLRDPEGYGRPLIDKGVRLCCENDPPRKPAVPPAAALPYVVLRNLGAFRSLFAPSLWARTRAALAAAAEAAPAAIAVPLRLPPTPPSPRAGPRPPSPLGRHPTARALRGVMRTHHAGRRAHEAGARWRAGPGTHRSRRLRAGVNTT